MNECSGTGILLAIGDFPEGSATASRLGLLASTLYEGGLPVEVAILHATLKQPIPENRAVSGVFKNTPFTYLSGTSVRPRGLWPALRDTVRGIAGAVRILSHSTHTQIPFLIVYTPTLLKEILPLLVARIRGIPIFIEACEIQSAAQRNRNRHWIGSLLLSFDWILERLAPKLCCGLIPISRGISDHYRRIGIPPEATYLLPILVDAKLYTAASTDTIPELEHRRFFLNSGTFVKKEGVYGLIDAFRKVAARHPDILLAFTGNVAEKDKEDVRSRLATSGLSGRIHFVGHLSRSQLIWAYQNATALLSCRERSTFAGYGFATKLGEYLSSGRPVIATLVGDVGHYLEDGQDAYLAEPENPDDIAHCMERVLRDPEQAARVGNAGRDVALRHFDYRNHRVPLATFVRARIATHNLSRHGR